MMPKPLAKALPELTEPFTLLVIPPPEKGLETYLNLIEYCSKKGRAGICITLTRTVNSLLNILEGRKISTKSLYFIDCISKISGAETNYKNCEYVSHPSNLTDMSIAINNAINKTKGKRFWITDSWSSFLIYNEEKEVLRFSILVINRFRAKGISGFLITMKEKSYDPFNDKISAFCDRRVMI